MTSANRILASVGSLITAVCFLVSAVVGVQSQWMSKFPHGVHTVEAELECSTCHEGIEVSQSQTDTSLPEKAVCEGCHEGGDELSLYIPDSTLALRAHKSAAQVVEFSHERHLARGLQCKRCHPAAFETDARGSSLLPSMAVCMRCHNGTTANEQCSVCHDNRVSLKDIHPIDWRHQHGSQAVTDRSWCTTCHQVESDCITCHRGDNTTLSIHPGNYRLTHGLDAKSKKMDCTQCHDNQQFCVTCHEESNRIPLNHSTVTWRIEHGRAARDDIENCASCHDQDDPTCGRTGCHSDLDGVRGTDHPIHDVGGMLSAHGPWHSEFNYYCYQCHRNTNQPGTGFCGYCHDQE